jgi:MoxR-like ATPase
MDATRTRAPADVTQIGSRLQEAARILNGTFLDKQEIIRLLIISAVAGEHLILVGPPGTAKSAIIRTFARLIDARYFEYLLTRFTEPNEIFGPVDIKQFREGHYTRRTELMLPEAELVFLDEIFKSNSAILNSLLTVLNERRFSNGAQIVRVPLISLFGASNEVPNDENLAAMFDRFLLRVVSNNLDSYHFHNLVAKGLDNEIRQLQQTDVRPVIRAADLHALHASFDKLLTFSEDFIAKYKGLIFQIRSEGISVSDRRVVKLLKLFAASALFDGRRQVVDGDFFILKHI